MKARFKRPYPTHEEATGHTLVAMSGAVMFTLERIGRDGVPYRLRLELTANEAGAMAVKLAELTVEANQRWLNAGGEAYDKR